MGSARSARRRAFKNFTQSESVRPVAMPTNGSATSSQQTMIFVGRDDPFQSLCGTTPNSAVKAETEQRNEVFGSAPIMDRSSRKARPAPRPVLTEEPDDVTQRIEAELTRASFLADAVAQEAAGPESGALQYTTEPDHLAGSRRNARDAWCAVVLMGLFIVGGFIWATDRITQADSQIVELTQQLQAERMSILAVREENQKLHRDISDARAAMAKAGLKLAKNLR